MTPQIPKVQQTVSSDGAPPNPSSSQGHITSSDKHSYLFDVRTISYNICTYIYYLFFCFPWVISYSNLLGKYSGFIPPNHRQARDLRGQTCLHLASQNGDLGQELGVRGSPSDTSL